MRTFAIVLALLFAFGSTVAVADQKPGGNPESPSDDNKGAGNDPPGGAGGAPPGQTTNPNPGKLFEPGPEWLSGFVLIGENTPPGQGNWGGGRGNSGPGDKHGQNDKSKDGGQTPNDDK